MATSFVGRDDDLKRIEQLLDAGEGLIAIVGQPGIGKTRIARELAQRGGPIPFCEIGPATDVEGICRAVAAGLGVPLSTVGLTPAKIARLLADEPPRFIVLDNFEHVLEHARETVLVWREFTPEVPIIVTSRQRLSLPGEVVFELDRLGKEAMDLLLDRIHRAGRRYEPSDAELIALVEIANRLEGIPLAIELVAPRIALLGARTVAQRLRERFDLLSLPPLRTALEWSWGLLSVEEQQALARFAMFAGGFTAEAAEQLLGEASLDMLQRLRQRSLLVVSPPPGERFGFAFSVREFALEKLTAMGLASETRRLHAEYFARWAEKLEDTVPAISILEALAVERSNLIAACESALEAGLTEAALHTAAALQTLAWLSGPFHGYEALLTRAIDLAGPAPTTPAFIAALTARGVARGRLGSTAEARADLERAVALAAQAGESKLEGRARGRLGVLLVSLRDLEAARAELDRALVIQRRGSDRQAEAYALFALGFLVIELGDPEQATVLLERAHRLFEETGRLEMCAYVAVHLATALLHRGQFAEALRNVEPAVTAHQAVGNVQFEGTAVCTIGAAYLSHNEPERALSFLDRGLAILKASGDERTRSMFLGHRALALAALGRLELARHELAHAIDQIRGSPDRRAIAILYSWLAGIEAELDDVAAAERSIDDAEMFLAGVDAKAARVVLAVEATLTEVARARAAKKAGRPDHEAALLELARARFAKAQQPFEGGARSAEYCWYYVRLSCERVRRALNPNTSVRPPAPSESAVLVVDTYARWLKSPTGEHHSIARKVTLQRLLRSLVHARLEKPGEPVSSEDLLHAGWPNERMGHAAARNRLRVTLTRLRQLGLDEWIVGLRGGYLISPDLAVRQED